MIIQNQKELTTYQQAGRLSTKILKTLVNSLKPGIYPIQIDDLAQKLCQKHGVKSAFKGVKNQGLVYPYHTCISINHTVVHGVPSQTQKLKKGDLIKLDFGLIFKGLYTDHCVTLSLGKPTKPNQKLILTAQKAVQKAVFKATTGQTTGDLGFQMQTTAQDQGFDVLKQYIGHGIGRTLHNSPGIPAYGRPHTGQTLETGMVLCVEAQVVSGSDQVKIADDGWSVQMADHQNTAMFEYMVVVQPQKPLILTPHLDWPIYTNHQATNLQGDSLKPPNNP